MVNPIIQKSSEQDKQLEIDHLNSIISATRLINSSLDLDELMERIRTIARDELQAEKATIFLGTEENQKLHSAYLEDTNLDINLAFGSGLAGLVAKTGKSIVIDDAQNDRRFYKGVDEITGYVTKTVVCAPLYNKDQKLIGVFQALNSKNGKFSESDRRFLEDLSIQAALAIENAFLYAEALEKKKLEEEMNLAHDIQQKLLPLVSPQITGYDIHGLNIAAQAVGGDYYDFIELDKTSLLFALGDVSGKGMAAALLMANLQASLRAQAGIHSQIIYLTSTLNNHICNSTSSTQYITFFSGVLDTENNEVKYCNAGHNPPLLIKNNGDTELLDGGGIPLGFIPDTIYSESITFIEKGDILAVFSDGIIETFDADENEFGESRLAELIHKLKAFESKEIARKIIDELKEFAAGNPAADDVTLIIIKRAI